MINALAVPRIAERLLGITIPEHGLMYACSYEGLHTIRLTADPISVETDESGIEDYKLLEAKGTALGVMGGSPVHSDAKTSISYIFDPRASEQVVSVTTGNNEYELEFSTLSGDWFFATLSRCGHYLVLAEPYSLEIYALS